MKVSYIELLGEKHPMCFSLAASEELSGQANMMRDQVARFKLDKQQVSAYSYAGADEPTGSWNE